MKDSLGHTTEQEATRSYISIPASQRASDAAEIAELKTLPPFSITRNTMSITDFGYLDRMIALCSACVMLDANSFSSAVFNEDGSIQIVRAHR